MRPTTLWQAHLNGLFWGLGNGLVSTTLVTYLARELGAEGIAIGLIVASPNLAGGLRLFAPAILRWIGSRKWFAVAAFLLSCLLLLALPIVCEPKSAIDERLKLFWLVTLWGGWHFAMFLGVIALWSWLGDVAASATRGSFIGLRTSLMAVGQIVGILAAAGFAKWYPLWDPSIGRWETLAGPALAGAWCMILAIVPLIWMPEPPLISKPNDTTRQLLAAITDDRFRPLLGFWCYAGLANGVTQAAQAFFPIVVLKLPVEKTLFLIALMHIGQIIVAPLIGYWADRGNSRAIMIGSQVIVSIALLFFPLATREHPLWLTGAYLCWIAYAGLNVCLPHLMLKLSPGENSPPYISLYFALGGLVTAASSVLFGVLFDQLPRTSPVPLGPVSVDRFHLAFIVGTIMRLSAIGWLFYLPRDAGASAKLRV
ncbi:Major Facilitator Superfamily protein [Anatilimnocola aggregata]|uniref:Major Facilitator Superfamily protein n=1 Tax=Anatilimnocola aggregata TaxID=2528021 RepID=A0A517YBG3_9BACT|nr:MFS transporter [Anatilimnocola aggregata]QDU27554.1 Major Facilitator Superfamily protein [Anatilimnocola aggregata]